MWALLMITENITLFLSDIYWFWSYILKYSTSHKESKVDRNSSTIMKDLPMLPEYLTDFLDEQWFSK